MTGNRGKIFRNPITNPNEALETRGKLLHFLLVEDLNSRDAQDRFYNLLNKQADLTVATSLAESAILLSNPQSLDKKFASLCTEFDGLILDIDLWVYPLSEDRKTWTVLKAYATTILPEEFLPLLEQDRVAHGAFWLFALLLLQNTRREGIPPIVFYSGHGDRFIGIVAPLISLGFIGYLDKVGNLEADVEIKQQLPEKESEKEWSSMSNESTIPDAINRLKGEKYKPDISRAFVGLCALNSGLEIPDDIKSDIRSVATSAALNVDSILDRDIRVASDVALLPERSSRDKQQEDPFHTFLARCRRTRFQREWPLSGMRDYVQNLGLQLGFDNSIALKQWNLEGLEPGHIIWEVFPEFKADSLTPRNLLTSRISIGFDALTDERALCDFFLDPEVRIVTHIGQWKQHQNKEKLIETLRHKAQKLRYKIRRDTWDRIQSASNQADADEIQSSLENLKKQFKGDECNRCDPGFRKSIGVTWIDENALMELIDAICGKLKTTESSFEQVGNAFVWRACPEDTWQEDDFAEKITYGLENDTSTEFKRIQEASKGIARVLACRSKDGEVECVEISSCEVSIRRDPDSKASGAWWIEVYFKIG